MTGNGTKQDAIIDVLGSDDCIKILDFISKEKATASSISDEFECSASMVSYYLKKLFVAGLVKFEFDIKDMRKKYVVPSRSGNEIITKFQNGSLFD